MIKQNVLSFLKFVKNNFFHLVYFYLIYLIIAVYIGQAKVLPCYYGPNNVWLTCSLDGVREVGWNVVLFNNLIIASLYKILYNIALPLILSFFTVSKTVNKRLTPIDYLKAIVLGLFFGYLNVFISKLLTKLASGSSMLSAIHTSFAYFDLLQGASISMFFVIAIIWYKLYDENRFINVIFTYFMILLFALLIMWENYLTMMTPLAVGQ